MRNIPHKITGDTLTADEFDDINSELKNAITSTGQTLTSGNLYQLITSVAVYCAVGDFYIDSGSANAYVLAANTPLMAPIQYRDGFRARFKVTHSNTGASTVNIAGMGIKAIIKEDGVTALSTGDLTVGKHAEIIFHVDLDKFVLLGTATPTSFPVGINMWSDHSAAWTGWILVNDNTKTTIGDASSGSTIRANADCENLFTLYWGFNATDCPLYDSAGSAVARAGSAASDWALHRRIAIPASFRHAFATHDIHDTLRIGQTEGAKTVALVEANNGPHVHAISDPHHAHSYTYKTANYQSGGSDKWCWSGDVTQATSSNPTGISMASSGSGTAHVNMQPTIYKNLYIKL